MEHKLTKKYDTVLIIPHYNNLEGLAATLLSVSHKKRLHVLILDDGSDDDQKPLLGNLRHFLNSNISVEIYFSKENRGIAEVLNLGLKYILEKYDFKYVARIDCGDTCVANRFSVQEDFLKNNPNIDLVGSWVKFNSPEGEELFAVRPPSKHRKIKRLMPIRCNFIHPSVMYTRAAIEKIGLYPTNYEAAEDYAYFYDISKKLETANIPKYLTTVEYNASGISLQNRNQQNKSKLKVILSYSSLNLYSIYGVAYNLALSMVPLKLVFKTKKLILGTP